MFLARTLATIDVSAAMVDRLSSAAGEYGCSTQSCRRMTSPELALVAIVPICDAVASPRQSSGSTVQSHVLNPSRRSMAAVRTPR